MTQKAADKASIGFVEFVALIALMTALVALSIDAMLPALPDIGQELGVERSNDNQLIISLLFLGLSIGQIFYGPLSDSIGRKPAIYLGFAIFIVGCLFSLLATTFQMMLIGRFLQGVGVAGPRSVAVALVRDQYEGRAMARVMSFVMTVFILIPVIAPTFGQVVILFASWRAIFAIFLLLAVGISIWFAVRQPETLTQEKRRQFSISRIGRAMIEVCTNRAALGYTLAAGIISGGFIGYLNSSQQIFQEQYALGAQFPLYFAILALALGAASFANARLVMKWGMRALSNWATYILCGLSIIFLAIALSFAGMPPLWYLMGYLLAGFFAVGILFGNLNALAMEPLGHIAGVGAAVVGSVSTMLSSILGTVIGQAYNGTVIPLVSGFALLSLISILVMRWAESNNLESVPQPTTKAT